MSNSSLNNLADYSSSDDKEVLHLFKNTLPAPKLLQKPRTWPKRRRLPRFIRAWRWTTVAEHLLCTWSASPESRIFRWRTKTLSEHPRKEKYLLTLYQWINDQLKTKSSSKLWRHFYAECNSSAAKSGRFQYYLRQARREFYVSDWSL